MAVDEETIRWLRDEARDEGDKALENVCERALGGELRAVATVEETVRVKVARAHREHRGYGHS